MKEDSPVDGEGELRVWIQTICVAFVDIMLYRHAPSQLIES